jgi:hypothetical protein
VVAHGFCVVVSFSVFDVNFIFAGLLSYFIVCSLVPGHYESDSLTFFLLSSTSSAVNPHTFSLPWRSIISISITSVHLYNVRMLGLSLL